MVGIKFPEKKIIWSNTIIFMHNTDQYRKKIYEFLNHYSYYSVIRPSTGLTKEGIIRFTYKSLAHVRVRTWNWFFKDLFYALKNSGLNIIKWLTWQIHNTDNSHIVHLMLARHGSHSHLTHKTISEMAIPLLTWNHCSIQISLLEKHNVLLKCHLKTSLFFK